MTACCCGGAAYGDGGALRAGIARGDMAEEAG